MKPDGLDIYGIEMFGVSYASENKKSGIIERLCQQLEDELDNIESAESNLDQD